MSFQVVKNITDQDIFMIPQNEIDHMINYKHFLTDAQKKKILKDGAYYCYCAYVLRIARYSGFLWMVPTNTGIFLRDLKLYGE